MPLYLPPEGRSMDTQFLRGFSDLSLMFEQNRFYSGMLVDRLADNILFRVDRGRDFFGSMKQFGWKMFFLNDASFAHNKSVLYDILQFPDITGKIVFQQDFHNIGADTYDFFPSAGVKLFYEMIYKIGNVLASFF